MSPSLVPTNIPLLDEMLGGGFEVGSAVAYWSEVEVEVSALALQVAHNRMLAGDSVLFVSMTHHPNQIIESMNELGIHANARLISFLDFSPAVPLATQATGKPLVIELKRAPLLVTELVEKISLALQSQVDVSNDSSLGTFAQSSENGGRSCRLVIFDSLSALLDRLEEGEEKRIVEFVDRMKELFTKFDAAGIFVFTAWPYGDELVERVRNCFECVVDLKATPERPVYSMSVYRRSAGESPKNLAFFRVARSGGVKIYLPKLIVTGPFHAGKSSFVHSVSRGAVSADRLGTTVAIDYGHAEHKGFVLDLFGTPGQTRFDGILEKLGGSSVGVILLVSATDVRSFARARDQARLVKAENLPYIVAVNKADLRGAISIAAVRTLMRVPKRVPVVPLRAEDLSRVRPGAPCRLNANDLERALDAVVNEIVKAEGRQGK